MNEQIDAAFERQDYRIVAQLLQIWKQQSPDDPLLMLSIGRYQEETQKLDAAETTYLKVLKRTPHTKIMAQAREGLKRVQQRREADRQRALSEAKAAPGSEEAGMLFLEPVLGEARTAAAQGLATVMKLDPYTARMQVPSKTWRMYRVGSMGEMQYYGQALNQANTPAWWMSLKAVKAIPVFRIRFFRAVTPQVTVVCANDTGQLGTMVFDWSEITQRVTGLLPVFERVIDIGPWGRLQRKEKTQDYAQVLDLHLMSRQCILRLCDRTYDFSQGNPFQAPEVPNPNPGITRTHWNHLVDSINQQSQSPLSSDFTPFGEGAIEYLDLLGEFKDYIDLARLQPSQWDPAFHLYSSLIFLKNQANQ